MIPGTTQRYTQGPESLYLHAEEKALTFPGSKVDVPPSKVELSPFDCGFGKCNRVWWKGFAQSLFSNGFYSLHFGGLCLGPKHL